MKEFLICLEYIYESKTTELKLFLEKIEKKNKNKLIEILEFKDSEQRNLLFISCIYIEFSIWKDLLYFYKMYNINIFELDLFEFNWIDVICFKASSKSNNTKEFEYVKEIVELLIEENITIESEYHNPLLWCLYNGNVITSNVLYNKCPKLILKKNLQDITPLDFGCKEFTNKEIIKKNISFFEVLFSKEFDDFSFNTYKKEEGNDLIEWNKELINNENENIEEDEFFLKNYFKNIKKSDKVLLNEIINNSEDYIILQKILMISLNLKKVDFAINLTKEYGLSPFYFIDHNNPLFISAKLNLVKYLEFWIDIDNPIYFTNNQLIDSNYILNITNNISNNLYHIACLNNSFEYIKCLFKMKASPYKFNERGITPISLIKNIDTKKKVQNEYYLINFNKLALQYNENKTIDSESVYFKTVDYDYCIVSSEDDDNLDNSFVYQQLNNLKIRLNEVFKNEKNTINIESIKIKNNDEFIIYFFIKFDQSIIDHYCDFYKIKVFNINTENSELFNINNKQFYEPIRLTYFYDLIIKIIKLEFDIDYYVKNKIITDHFPLPKNEILKMIENKLWTKMLSSFLVLVNPFSFKSNSIYNLICIYFGSRIGYFYLFIFYYISWIFQLGIFGLIIYCLQCYFTLHNNLILGIYSLIIGLMSTIFINRWKYMFRKFLDIWGLNDIKKLKTLNKAFDGNFLINKEKKVVKKIPLISTNHRRAISEIPILLVGMFFVFILYNLNLKISEIFNTVKKLTFLSSMQKYVIIKLQGVAIALNNIFWGMIYGKFCNFFINNWENHKYIENQEKSLLFKTFIIKLCMYYINLIFLTFTNFESISEIFITIVLTKTIITLIRYIIIPSIKYLLKKKKIKEEIKNRVLEKRKNFKEKYNLDNIKEISEIISFINSDSNELKAINLENELISDYEISKNLIRNNQFPIDDILYEFVAQFGFVLFFLCVNPLSCVTIFIFDFIIIKIILMYQIKVVKRKKTEDIKELDYLNFIILFISFFGYINIILINYFGLKSLRIFFEFTNNKYMDLLIIILLEHLVLFIGFISHRIFIKQKNN